MSKSALQVQGLLTKTLVQVSITGITLCYSHAVSKDIFGVTIDSISFSNQEAAGEYAEHACKDMSIQVGP